jgi:hypothetical protein
MYIENNEGFSGTLRSESRRTFLRLCQPADVVRKMMWSKRHCEKLKKEHRHRSVRLRLTDSYTIPHDARTPIILRLVHIRSERLRHPCQPWDTLRLFCGDLIPRLRIATRVCRRSPATDLIIA